jgi:hypothetical protein
MTEGVARNPAAPTSAMNATAATIQAGCRRRSRLTRPSLDDPGRRGEWPAGHHAQ